MDQKNTLRPYIEAQLKANVPAEAIKQALVSRGWGEAIVSEVINETTWGIQAAQQPQPTLPVEPNIQLNPAVQPADLKTQLEPIRDETLPEKYGVIDAYKDAAFAIKNNVLAIGVMSLMGLGVLVIGTILVTVLGVTSMAALVVTFGRGLSQTLISFGLLFLLLIVVSSLLTAFVQALIGLAINDGAKRQKSAIKITAQLALKQTIRITLANMIFSLLLSIPLALAASLGLLISIIMPNLGWVTFILVIMGLFATIPLMLRFALIPLVALFEKDVPLRKLIRRTKTLMNGGMAFIAKIFAIGVIVLVVLSFILPNEQELDNMSFIAAVPSNILSGCIYLLMYSVLVVFYRNRKAIKA